MRGNSLTIISDGGSETSNLLVQYSTVVVFLTPLDVTVGVNKGVEELVSLYTVL